MSRENWFAAVDRTIKKWFLLDHPFNQAWREGRLKLQDIQIYSQQYFRHVDAFPRYVSAVHSNTSDLATRQMLLENLIEEERGAENHPELFLRFCEGAGLKRDQVLTAPVREETRACVDTFIELTRHPNHLVGLSALYAYESQIPEVSATKVKRLDVHYGIIDERAYQFFKVHEKADVWHSSVERDAIREGARTDADRALVRESVESACRAVWGLFDGVSKACEAHA